MRADDLTALPYARQDSLAFVLYYNQRILAGDAAKRAGLQRDLVNLAQRAGGTFYLPYLRNYSAAQLRASYPGYDAALAFKNRVDPAGRFARVLKPTGATLG